MVLPDPVEAIKFERERQGLTVKDLEPLIGRPNRVYEVLAHKRPLTLRMIWNLHRASPPRASYARRLISAQPPAWSPASSGRHMARKATVDSIALSFGRTLHAACCDSHPRQASQTVFGIGLAPDR